MWEVFIQYLRGIEPLLTFLSTLLWGIYVYFTIRTFQAIERQTDLQVDAFLVVTASRHPTVEAACNRVCQEASTLTERWKTILSNLPDSPDFGPQFARLQLRNRGRSDIVSWILQLTVSVQPGQLLESKYNTHGEDVTWTLHSNGADDMIAPSSEIVLGVCQMQYFPKGSLRWEVQYTDSRNKVYIHFGGDSDLETSNIAYFQKADQLDS